MTADWLSESRVVRGGRKWLSPRSLAMSLPTGNRARISLFGTQTTCFRAGTVALRATSSWADFLKFHYSLLANGTIWKLIFNSALSFTPFSPVQFPSPTSSASKIHPHPSVSLLFHCYITVPPSSFSHLGQSKYPSWCPNYHPAPWHSSLFHSWPKTSSEAPHCIQNNGAWNALRDITALSLLNLIFSSLSSAALAFSGFLKHTKLSHAHFLLSFLCETDPTSPLGVGLNISFSEREFSAHLPWYRFLSGLLLFLYSMHYSWQLIHLFTQCTFLSLPLYLGSSKCEKSTQHLLRNTKGRVWTLC